jgi:hypothetical protein
MTFALVTSAKANGATGGTTGAVDTTGSKLLVIQAGFTGAATISDSKGNTWTAATLYSASLPNTRWYYCLSPTVGAGHTFTIAASVGSIVVSAWSVTNTPVFDSESAAGNSAGAVFAPFGNASFTPGAANCLLIGGGSFPNPGYSSGYAAGSGWTLIDVNNYVGGTSYGSSQAYKIQTTATAVPTSEHVTDWTGATAVSFLGIAFKEVVSAGLTVSSPVAFKTFARSGSTGSIAITGSHTGATEDIEASFNGGAYQTIAVASVAGAYSGTLTAQPYGRGTLTVRKKVTTAASATVANVAVGDVFGLIGDSRVQGRATNAQNYSAVAPGASKFNESDVWGDGVDPISTGSTVGSHWPLVAQQLLTATGVPVAFVSCGVGSTDMAGAANQWAKPNSAYTAMVSQCTDSGVTSFKGMLAMFGPNAVVNASTLSKATYNTAVDTLVANIAADIAGAPKVLIDICGEVSTGSPPDRRAALDNIRGAIIEAGSDNANVYVGPCLVDQDYSDGVHFQSDAAELEVAKRQTLAILQFFYATGTNGRGPRLSSAAWNGARNQITVAFNQVLKTGLTHATAAWKVSDNGTPMTISGITYHGSNPNALVVTVSAPAAGPAASSTVTFASGEDAKGLVVPMSADISMPVGAAIQIPAEPIYAAAVSETAVVAFTGTVSNQSATVGVPFSLDLSSYFSGSLTPFTYSTFAGTLPAGLTRTGAVISGTPTLAGASSGIQVRATDTGANTATTNAFSITVAAPIVKTATVTLTSDGTTPRANLTNLKWAWFDQVTPNLFVAPTDKGSSGSTDANGLFSVTLVNTSLSFGGVGWLSITDSDGTTTQSPVRKIAAGPLAIS